jgi:hypothetical protein
MQTSRTSAKTERTRRCDRAASLSPESSNHFDLPMMLTFHSSRSSDGIHILCNTRRHCVNFVAFREASTDTKRVTTDDPSRSTSKRSRERTARSWRIRRSADVRAVAASASNRLVRVTCARRSDRAKEGDRFGFHMGQIRRPNGPHAKLCGQGPRAEAGPHQLQREVSRCYEITWSYSACEPIQPHRRPSSTSVANAR